jgi:hypothetical protein
VSNLWQRKRKISAKTDERAKKKGTEEKMANLRNGRKRVMSFLWQGERKRAKKRKWQP